MEIDIENAMFWLIIVLAVVVTLWSFWRCGKLLRRLELINEASCNALRDRVDLQDAMWFISLESNLNLTSGKYKDVKLIEKKEI